MNSTTVRKCVPFQFFVKFGAICTVPKEELLILNCIDKAKLFNEHFSNECKLIVDNSSLLVSEYITDKRKNSVSIKNEEILFLIRKLNPNKAAGTDGISGATYNATG